MIETMQLNAKQREIKKLHELTGGFDLDEALKKLASKPRGRPVGSVKPKPKVEIPVEEPVLREGRFLLEHLENVNVPTVRKDCLECGEAFLSNYKFIALCSDTCRAERFQKKYGFKWDPTRAETERWQFWKIPPSVVAPETLKRLEAFARSVLGIEPTEADLALTKTQVEVVVDKPNDAGNLQAGVQGTDPKGVRLPGENVPEIAERSETPETDRTKDEEGNRQRPRPTVSAESFTPSSAADAPGPKPIPDGQQSAAAEIRRRFREGKITAHELQEQLAAVFRG